MGLPDMESRTDQAHQVIPAQVVEAAAFVISYRMSATEDDWQTVARAALEAAAPHMLSLSRGEC